MMRSNVKKINFCGVCKKGKLIGNWFVVMLTPGTLASLQYEKTDDKLKLEKYQVWICRDCHEPYTNKISFGKGISIGIGRDFRPKDIELHEISITSVDEPAKPVNDIDE